MFDTAVSDTKELKILYAKIVCKLYKNYQSNA